MTPIQLGCLLVSPVYKRGEINFIRCIDVLYKRIALLTGGWSGLLSTGGLVFLSSVVGPSRSGR